MRSQPVHPTNNKDSIVVVFQWLTPLDQLVEGFVKNWPLVGWQPKLRVIGKTDRSLFMVDVVVDFDIMSFVPFC